MSKKRGKKTQKDNLMFIRGMKRFLKRARPEDKCREALACHDRCIRIDPTSFIAWYNKGVTLACMRKMKEAKECYKMAQKLNPDLPKPQEP